MYIEMPWAFAILKLSGRDCGLMIDPQPWYVVFLNGMDIVVQPVLTWAINEKPHN